MNSVNTCPHVLMVDTGGSCKDIERFLSDSGVTVVIESDSEKALDTAKSANVDVILTEMSVLMPSGEPLVELLCNLCPSKAVIVVGSLSHEDAVSFLDLGAVSYFKRPLDLSDLETAIRHVFTSRPNNIPNQCSLETIEDNRYYELTCLEISESTLRFETANMLHKSGLISENDRLRFELVFQEAMANALEHGNLELKSLWKEEIDSNGVDKYTRTKAARLKDPEYSSKKVKIWMGYKNKELYLRIKDEGKGFVKQQPKKKEEANLTPHGRGITIMNAAMDKVEYLGNGSEIFMTKAMIDEKKK